MEATYLLALLFGVATLAVALVLFLKIIREWSRLDNPLTTYYKGGNGLYTLATLITIGGAPIGFMVLRGLWPDHALAPKHVLSLYTLLGISILAYWVSMLWKQRLPDWANLLLRTLMSQGIILSVVFGFHLGVLALLGFVIPIVDFVMLALPFTILLLIFELWCNWKQSFRDNKIPFNPSWSEVGVQPVLLVALVLVQQAALLPFGQVWNSLQLVFTQTSGLTFSSHVPDYSF